MEEIPQFESKRFSETFLYYPDRRHLPAPIRAFVDFIKS